MLERLFTSRTRVKLLEACILNPDKKFYLRELARKISANPTYAKEELDNLVELGLISFEKKGNLSLYAAKKNSPIFEDLKNIFLKTECVGALLKEKIENYSGIKFAVIYGSFAKGTQRETSDIDVLIVGEIKEKDLLEIVRKFENKTGRELNYVLWAENELRKKVKEKIPMLADIKKNKFLIVKGDENEFRRAIEK